MNTRPAKPKKSTTEDLTKQTATTVAEPASDSNAAVQHDQPSVPTKSKPTEKTATQPKTKSVGQIALELGKPLKLKKKHNDKVIRDSFSFPELDYLKILQIKAICLSAGVQVKKGEVLRAGLNLLMQLSENELKEVIGKVERVKTGRPLSNKA